MMIGRDELMKGIMELDPIDDSVAQCASLGIDSDELVDFAVLLEKIGIGGIASSFCAGFTLGVFIERENEATREADEE